MGAAVIINLITEVGLPAARQLIAMWRDNKEATPEEWLALLPKVRPYEEYIKEAQAKLT